MAKVKVLRQKHPDYNADQLARLEGLYEGGEVWRELLKWWLPKNAAEMSNVYSDRLKRASYTNHFGSLTDLWAAFLFAEAPTLEGSEDDFWADFWEDADGKGSTMGQFWRARLLEALWGRQSHVWINLPPEGEEPMGSLQEQESAGLLDPFLVALGPRQVIDWGEDDKGNLLWVMVEGTVSVRKGPDEPRTRKWVWTHIDAKEIRRWEWTPKDPKDPDPKPGDEDSATELTAVAHPFGALPVVRLGLPSGLWAGAKMHDPAISLLRGENDLDFSLHRAAHALMFIKSKWGDDSPVQGAGYYIQLGLEDDIGYVEPSGAQFEALAKDVVRRREELHRVVQLMAVGAGSNVNRARMSGESKEKDWKAVDIVLHSYAELTKAAIEQTAQIIAKLRNIGDTLKVAGLDSWSIEDLEQFMAAAAMALDARDMSETFRRVVAKRQAKRLLEDEVDAEVMAQIEKEIDEADLTPQTIGFGGGVEEEEREEEGEE